MPADLPDYVNDPLHERIGLTAIRDDLSRLQRSATDLLPDLTRYPISRNTAFLAIMSEHERKNYFFCNDLKKLGVKYKNGNPDWREYYNSVIVVPIKAPESSAVESALGFLCVDSKDGKFDELIATATLICISDILYNQIQLFPQTSTN